LHYTLPFSEISKSDTNIAGGKGASLGEMTQQQIPIPEGFVVLTNAFEEFIKKSNLKTYIDQTLKNLNYQSTTELKYASNKIQEKIIAQALPPKLTTALNNAFESLNSKYVAVRSSATSEDSKNAAWAGQLDSFLNTTIENLIPNLKKCWASLFSARALFYRFEKNLQNKHISIAVVIQKMIQSEKSGVAFSINPINSNPHQIIIESGFGIGEAIVSGQITPDKFIISKQDFSIIKSEIQKQEKKLVKNHQGGTQWIKTAAQEKKSSLNLQEIKDLSKVVNIIENHYKFPCDIEWVQYENKFYIVQSRPITNIKDTHFYHPVGKLVSSRARPKKTCQPFPAIFTQEYLASQQMQKMYGHQAHAIILTWLHNDITTSTDSQFDQEQIGQKLCDKILQDPTWLDQNINWSQSQINTLKTLIESNLPKKKISKINNSQIAKIYLDYCKQYTNFHLKNTPAWWIGSSTLEHKLEKQLTKENLTKLQIGPLLEPLEFEFEIQQEEKNLLKICHQISKNNYSLSNLTSGIQTLIDKHVDTFSSIPFGYQNNTLWDNEFITNKIKNILQTHNPNTQLQKMQKQLENKKLKQKKLINKLKISKQLTNIITTIKKLSYLQDLKKTFQTRSHPHLQMVVFPEIARRLKIDKKYLGLMTPHEVKECLQAGKINNQLKQELKDRDQNSILIARNGTYQWILKEDAINFAACNDLIQTESNTSTLKGNIACSGITKGKAKICDTANDIQKVNKGDILVASMTTPDYIPAMKKAAAIITDEGGITCHAAIIAREFNIPCIIGTKNATKTLKDNNIIEVNANNGTITILNSQNN